MLLREQILILFYCLLDGKHTTDALIFNVLFFL